MIGRASTVLCKIGAKALVKVTQDGKLKWASAHDLRRSFGERWAARIMPQQLMELMRHESIETTMRYYVGRNAQKTAEALWVAVDSERGNTVGNTAHSAGDGRGERIDVNAESRAT